MSIAGYKALRLPAFGGWCTLLDADAVPLGLSPDLRDVSFPPGQVVTRPGLTKYGFNLTFFGNVTGLHNYIQDDLTPLLVLSGGAALYVANVETLNVYSILTTWAIGSESQMAAANLLGRAFIGIGDGKHGLISPRQLLGSGGSSFTFDRIALDGPYAFTMTVAENVAAGNISAGVHKLVVLYKTRSDYLTRPMPVGIEWTATGAKKVDVGTIPVGPANVIQRILAFTAAGSSSYYYIPKAIADGGTILDDNTTTSITALDFTDSALLNGINVDDLFRRIELPDASGCLAYGNRMVYWGCRNSLNYAQQQTPNVVLGNLGFDAGFTGNVPLLWTEIIAGESKESVPATGFGFGLKVTGDGVSAIRGKIQHALFTSSDLFVPGKNYRVRAWLRKVGDASNVGRFRILFPGSVAPGISTQGTASGSSQIVEFNARIWDATDPVQNTRLEVRVENTPPAIGEYYFDEIVIYPEDEPFQESVVYVSKPEDLEAIDGLDGFVQPSPGDGQGVRCCFAIRNFLYLCKERSLWVTADDGNSEPANWDVEQVSDRVGTLSSRGVGMGDEWAVIAARSGLWYFSGGQITEDHKLSQEIQPTWDAINWQYGHIIQVHVDTQAKRIYVLVPMGSATTINETLVLDYIEGFGDPLRNDGHGRKWCPWFAPVSSVTSLQRTSGGRDVVFGSRGISILGTAYKLDNAALSDDGTAINSYYQTAYAGNGERNEFGYLTVNVDGLGLLSLSAFMGGPLQEKTIRGWTLDTQGFNYRERQINLLRERIAFKFGTNAVGSYFRMKQFLAWVKPSMWSAVRGVNR